MYNSRQYSMEVDFTQLAGLPEFEGHTGYSLRDLYHRWHKKLTGILMLVLMSSTLTYVSTISIIHVKTDTSIDASLHRNPHGLRIKHFLSISVWLQRNLLSGIYFVQIRGTSQIGFDQSTNLTFVLLQHAESDQKEETKRCQ